MKKTGFLAAIALQTFLVANASAATPTPLKGLDAYVHKAMKQWQVPGLAVAVVKDGKVVLARDLHASAAAPIDQRSSISAGRVPVVLACWRSSVSMTDQPTLLSASQPAK